MSTYTRMGTIAATAIVSLEPDRSGNFIADGTADDVELQAAITYVNVLGGGKVFVLDGTYILTAQLGGIGYTNVTITGNGRSTVIYVGNAQNINAFFFEDSTGIMIANLQIDGNKANNTFAGNDYFQNGVLLDNCSECILTNLWVHDTCYNGLYVGYGALPGDLGADTNNTIVKGIISYNNEIHGIELNCARNITCVGNVCKDNGHLVDATPTGSGIMIYGVIQASCVGNVLEGNNACGVNMSGSINISVSSNNIRTTGDSGIQVLNSTDVTVADNTLHTLGYCGIKVGSPTVASSRISVVGNTIYDTGLDGIRLDATEALTDWIVGSNIIYDVIEGQVAIVVNGADYGNVSDNVIRELPVNVKGIQLLGNPICVNIVGNVVVGGQDGIVSGGVRCNINGNILYDQARYGVWFNYATEGVIDGNLIYSPGDNGIYIQGTSNVVCTSNSVSGAAGDGIEVNGSSSCLVVGNRIFDSGAYGIMVDANSDYNRFESNFTSGSTTACARVNNANCTNNVFTDNNFDEGDISNIGTNTRAWLNYDPSANAFITTINPPATTIADAHSHDLT